MIKMKQKQWIDISLTIKSGMINWPSDPAVKIERVKDLKKKDKCNLSLLTMGSHTGTHMDAPYHFFKHGDSLDQMPLEATIGPARVVEIRNRESIKVQELKQRKIRFGERVLFKTINSSSWKSGKFNEKFVYLTKEAAKYLADAGVTAVGIDYLSVGGFQKDGVETHKALLNDGIWIIEGLDLSKVKDGRYELICLPMKILDSDGAPARAILRERR